eukprot:TRINITY_DN11484_c0_g1_i1.p2 TRINITY_DN11484_c0_g1~~TRINITY_DN11484_c0_g1_i1.p2  ORF type:complete len:102 (+),score=8.68 TRINITY_DN11484_c0_g1_i1:309-614(+)
MQHAGRSMLSTMSLSSTSRIWIRAWCMHVTAEAHPVLGASLILAIMAAALAQQAVGPLAHQTADREPSIPISTKQTKHALVQIRSGGLAVTSKLSIAVKST